jgi:hypothetical protein
MNLCAFEMITVSYVSQLERGIKQPKGSALVSLIKRL